MLVKRTNRLMTGLTVVVIAAIGALLALDLRLEAERELRALEEELMADARLLAEHANLSIQAADLVLASTESDVRNFGLAALANDRDYWESMREMLADTPQLASLGVADDQGQMRITSNAFPSPEDFNVADREYFTAVREPGAHYIGAPVVGRELGRPLIPISKGLVGDDGEFLGAVLAMLDVAYFNDFYAGLPYQLGRRVGMYRTDGSVLSIYPAPLGLLPAYSVDNVPEEFAGGGNRSYVGRSPLDAQKRIIAFAFVGDYPIAVTASSDYDTFIATLQPAWWRNGAIFLVFALALSASTIVLRKFIVNADAARTAQLKSARKQRRSERLSRAITRHLPNGRVAIVDSDLHYLFVDGQGFSEDARLASDHVVGKALREVHQAATAEALEALARAALAGREAEAEITLEHEIHKVIAVPLEDDEHQVDQVMLLTQDITDLKATQRELEERNRELREISFTDALLDIANRRAFDQEIKREWRRGLRKREALALLMVDVDHFKEYNDNYGHAEGDECLQQVASALEEAVFRPGDVVARYGGEEMVVLLPESSLGGALQVAERIHARLAAKAIPFPDSPGGNTLTVSIGAAALRPTPDLSHSDLIEAADEALYAAKELGRNRTATSADVVSEQ